METAEFARLRKKILCLKNYFLRDFFLSLDGIDCLSESPSFWHHFEGGSARVAERGYKQFMMDECFMRFYHFWSIRLVCGGAD